MSTFNAAATAGKTVAAVGVTLACICKLAITATSSSGVGENVGELVGLSTGIREGSELGSKVIFRIKVGEDDGSVEGVAEGSGVGCGTTVGSDDGEGLGDKVVLEVAPSFRKTSLEEVRWPATKLPCANVFIAMASTP
jgi:hypothetical protein